MSRMCRMNPVGMLAVAIVLALVLPPHGPVAAADTALAPVSCSFVRAGDGLSATVSWVRAADDGATRFVVEKSRNGGSWFWAAKAEAPALSLVASGLDPDDSYAFRAKARDGGGPKSAPTSCTEATPMPDTALAPASCSFVRAGDGLSATVSWVRAADDGATRFVVEKSRNGGSWFWAAKAEAPSLELVAGGLLSGDTYTFRVRARNNGGPKSAPTTCVEGVAPDGPKAPVSCSFDRAPQATSASIEWVRADGDEAAKFIIERSRNEGPWYWTGAVAVPSTTFVRSGLGPLADYTFRVRTKAAHGDKSDPTPCAEIPQELPPVEIILDMNDLGGGNVGSAATGINLNWLLDSDIERPRDTSMAEAIEATGLRVLRFPFGHLADNYLWDTAPLGGELAPRVATQSEAPGVLAGDGRDWSWAVHPDGSFIDAMDFDEFMGLADATGSSSLVVVNAAAHKYENGPSYAELKETAVEWVRHAQAMGYDVDYWQIGNEADHQAEGVLTAEEYVALYDDFSTAMRQVDPSIAIGPGLIGLGDFASSVVAAVVDDADFVSAHQYALPSWETYGDWKRSTADTVPNISRMQGFVAQSANPDVPILVTETNSSGSGWSDGQAITTYKALALFEMLMEQHELANVESSLIWSTHSPWKGENFVGDVRNTYRNDSTNAPMPNGLVMELFGRMVQPELLASIDNDGDVRSWASADPDTGALTLFFLNKGETARSVDVSFAAVAVADAGVRSVFSGTSPADPAPTLRVEGQATINATGVSTELPGAALTVLELVVA